MESVETRNSDKAKAYFIEFSTGVATLIPSGEESLEDLLAQADEAMYQNKKARRASGVTVIPSSETLRPV